MSFDPVDVWGGAVGSLFKRFVYFASAIWIGCIAGVAALVVSWLVAGGTLRPEMIWSVLLAPVELLNEWLPLNFLTVMIGLVYSVKAEDPGFRAWMALAGLASLGVKLGDPWSFSGDWKPITAGWTFWLILIVMTGAGTWLLRQHFINRWALHLLEVQAEATVRELERGQFAKARLQETKPPEAPPGVIVDLKR